MLLKKANMDIAMSVLYSAKYDYRALRTILENFANTVIYIQWRKGLIHNLYKI